MTNSSQGRDEVEIEHLRRALDAETRARLELQRQLDRAGAEFEEFVSTAAHHLRESLRDVAAFSQLMAETNAGRFDSDAAHFDPDAAAFLDHIREGAAKMQSLLADVVDYWSVGTGARQFFPTDMELVLGQALLRTGQQIAERGAAVTHDPLPPSCGDFDTLSKVLHHLIRNAIEYCGTPSPRVHLSSKRVGLEWVFSVQDNGPGIDPAFQQRVFGTFKRLHGKKLPGNGLGLAFCKKAIEWQGGRMWIESTPGAGSTFYFTLPVTQPEEPPAAWDGQAPPPASPPPRG